jgi:hypothetical protein
VRPSPGSNWIIEMTPQWTNSMTTLSAAAVPAFTERRPRILRRGSPNSEAWRAAGMTRRAGRPGRHVYAHHVMDLERPGLDRSSGRGRH